KETAAESASRRWMTPADMAEGSPDERPGSISASLRAATSPFHLFEADPKKHPSSPASHTIIVCPDWMPVRLPDAVLVATPTHSLYYERAASFWRIKPGMSYPPLQFVTASDPLNEASKSTSSAISDQERYSRQILFRGIGPHGQRMLTLAHVAIVGCGATGAA